MEKILEKLFDFKKIPTQLILVVWVISVILIFVPSEYISKLNLTKFNEDYGKPYSGIVFLVSSAFLIVTIFNTISTKIRSQKFNKEREASIVKSVTRLDEHEKATLREFFITSSHTIQFPIDNPSVTGLITKGIIYPVSNTAFTYVHGAYLPYCFTEIAFREINGNPHLIGLPTQAEGITMEYRQILLNARPSWAITKSRWESL